MVKIILTFLILGSTVSCKQRNKDSNIQEIVQKEMFGDGYATIGPINSSTNSVTLIHCPKEYEDFEKARLLSGQYSESDLGNQRIGDCRFLFRNQGIVFFLNPEEQKVFKNYYLNWAIQDRCALRYNGEECDEELIESTISDLFNSNKKVKWDEETINHYVAAISIGSTEFLKCEKSGNTCEKRKRYSDTQVEMITEIFYGWVATKTEESAQNILKQSCSGKILDKIRCQHTSKLVPVGYCFAGCLAEIPPNKLDFELLTSQVKGGFDTQYPSMLSKLKTECRNQYSGIPVRSSMKCVSVPGGQPIHYCGLACELK